MSDQPYISKDSFVSDKGSPSTTEEKENPFKLLAKLKQQKIADENAKREALLSGKGPDGLVRHDAALVLSGDVSEEQLKAITEDMKQNLIYFRLKKDEKSVS